MKVYLIIISLFLIFSCSSQKTNRVIKCLKTHKKIIKRTSKNDNYNFIKNDTNIFNEIRYGCIDGFNDSHFVMYDKFGKWNKTFYSDSEKLPILIWENIDLFENDKSYTVLTNGNEERNNTYASFIVFDDKGNDLLVLNSLQRKKLINFFHTLMKTKKSTSKEFYEVYWKEADPEYWIEVKKYLNRNK
jgi:hypothetical protein